MMGENKIVCLKPNFYIKRKLNHKYASILITKIQHANSIYAMSLNTVHQVQALHSNYLNKYVKS